MISRRWVGDYLVGFFLVSFLIRFFIFRLFFLVVVNFCGEDKFTIILILILVVWIFFILSKFAILVGSFII